MCKFLLRVVEGCVLWSLVIVLYRNGVNLYKVLIFEDERNNIIIVFLIFLLILRKYFLFY